MNLLTFIGPLELEGFRSIPSLPWKNHYTVIRIDCLLSQRTIKTLKTTGLKSVK